MYPLRPLFEQVTGDPDQMRSTAAGWERMAGLVRSLADVAEQESLATYWAGPAQAAHDKQKTETSAISFGSSVAAAWSVTVARFSVTLSRILMQISRALQWLVRALRALKRIKTAVLLVRVPPG